MSDIFQEIEEDIRREKLDKVWEQYGSWIMIGAGVLVMGIAAWLWMGEAAQRRNAELSDAYLSANELLASGDIDGGTAELEDIIANKSGGYVVLAGMQRAAKLADAGDLDGAVGAYDAIRSSNKTEDVLGQLAAIKAGWLLVETEGYEAMTSRLGEIAFAVDEGPWAAGATEILAYSAVRAGKLEEAEGLYEKIRTMRSATMGIVGRSAEMLAIIQPQIVRTPTPVEETQEPVSDSTSDDTTQTPQGE